MDNKCLFMFREFGSLPDTALPSIKEFFEEKEYSGKDKIIAYMKGGRKTYSSPVVMRDFFTGERIPGEKCGITDGEYRWNAELIHYIEKYNLRLPEEFEKKVLGML